MKITFKIHDCPDCFVAQGLQSDIATQALTLDELAISIDRILLAYRQESILIPSTAPQECWDRESRFEWIFNYEL
jgi:hypothetical protein